MKFSNIYIVDKIIKDIIKNKYLFLEEINEKKLEVNILLSQIYSIALSFYLERIDLTYNENIIPLIYILLLKRIPEEKVFVCLYNLIFQNNTISKFYLSKTKYVNFVRVFFEETFKKNLPGLHQHFEKLGISSQLYFYDWIESLFTKCLDVKIASIIIDLYLILGELLN